MAGRIRRKQLAAAPLPAAALPRLCPLCEREIPDAQKDAHHLVPRSKGGTTTAYLHRICHRQIHSLLTETELARQYHTADALRAHPALAEFIAGVRTKPNDFYQRTAKSARLRRR